MPKLPTYRSISAGLVVVQEKSVYWRRIHRASLAASGETTYLASVLDRVITDRFRAFQHTAAYCSLKKYPEVDLQCHVLLPSQSRYIVLVAPSLAAVQRRSVCSPLAV